jgi:membrane protease YdiL (CAAX protease family)
MMLGLDLSLHRRTLDSVGFGVRHFRPGVLRGLLGTFITFPLIICATLIVEQIYRAVHFDHPSAHELLAEMKQTREPMVRAALILGATVLAPLFEEYLLRGHIQTFLVSIFTMSQRRPQEVIVTAQPQTLDPSAPNTPPLDYQTPPPLIDRRTTRAVWMGILLTSVLFALIHPLWTAPLIFVLSVCLGYAYERTGNLWVPITIHALFNTISTIEYLYFF